MVYKNCNELPPVGQIVKIVLVREIPAIRIDQQDGDIRWQVANDEDYPLKVMAWKPVVEEELEVCKAALHKEMELQDVPFFSISNEELEAMDDAEDNFVCSCGETHPVTVNYSEGDKKVSMGTYECQGQSFLYSIQGKQIKKPNL